jgi:hypothetical protein
MKCLTYSESVQVWATLTPNEKNIVLYGDCKMANIDGLAFFLRRLMILALTLHPRACT